MRRKTLLDTYYELKESGSTSDFPNLLANVMYKILLDKFKSFDSPWKQYTMQSDLADFKTHNRVIVSGAPDLLEVAPDGEYSDSNLTDYNYGIALQTFGRTFSIGRRTVINDDLNAIRQQPARFGRAAARTLVKKIVNQIEGDGLMYDGNHMFTLGHGNYSDTALANTAAGAAAVQTAMVGIKNQTDPDTGEKMGLKPKYLVVPTDLEFIGGQLIRSAQIWPVSTNGGGTLNAISGLELLVEPFLTSTTGWYVMADPADAPVVEVGFLGGKETPDLLMKRADTVNLAGGEDEWGYDFDEIFYKVRYDFALARAMYQGIYRGKA
ncbi:MAG: capsid maturation protease [Siphoviridae sp. ctCJE6]|nr:MAG: capsid maturation protease [Siphoviridae sp. ctCJE6]